jgi:hypothetical protein
MSDEGDRGPLYGRQARLFAAPRRSRGRCRRSSDITIRALRAHGRLEPVDEAIIVAHRVAADNVDAAERARDADEGSAFVVANALRTYLIATAGLYARVGMIEADDEDELWSALSAPVGDTPPA